MKIEAETPEQYIAQLPADRQPTMEKLRETMLKNLPQGFAETMNYNMITYVVPHSLYPPGYHCAPAMALPFISIAAQKNFFAIYHMGIYMDSELLNWFTTQFSTYGKTKLDMGKSCIRFKKVEHIPFELIAELAAKTSVEQWITLYTKTLKS
ncbi:MAG TPA: hypothetical protein DCQ31_04315 [Bacteroidales bacterium]|nr:hypothetical protein [Bacteroidales bacterium]